MKTLILASLAGLLLAAPAAAPAKIIQVGDTPATAVAPSCPGTPCLAMTRTTGYQAKVGTQRGLMVIPADGRIVAFRLALGATGPKQTTFFQQRFGGDASARLTILRPGSHLFARVVNQSSTVDLMPYLGQTVDFALTRTLTVHKGELVALTVPTWAPVLAVNLGKDTSWRSSRSSSCDDPKTQSTQTSQTTIGALTQYRCLYATARLTYSATLVTAPVANKP